MPTKHAWHLLGLAVAIRCLTTLSLLVVPQILPAFDPSASQVLAPQDLWLQGFLRWDTLYFDKIARDGYTREQEFAFLPTLPFIMRWSGYLLACINGQHVSTAAERLLATVVLANLATVGSVWAFYLLSCKVLKDRNTAFMASVLYCLTPAPATLSSPYNEPFFALLAYWGMLAIEKRSFFAAALLFAGATAFRANGMLHGGFFIWHLVLQQRPSLVKWAKAVICAVVTMYPFIAFQRFGYATFCLAGSMRPWCQKRLPLIYPFVQSYYWDVGFLRYWTLQQLPLFMLSAPILAISFHAAFHYYKHAPRQWLQLTLPFVPPRSRTRKSKNQRRSSVLGNPAVLPYMHLHALLTCILLFNSHVQICLRLVALDPVVFWWAATLMEQQSKYGRWWLRYCSIWAPVSVVLWAGFYPPA